MNLLPEIINQNFDKLFLNCYYNPKKRLIIKLLLTKFNLNTGSALVKFLATLEKPDLNTLESANSGSIKIRNLIRDYEDSFDNIIELKAKKERFFRTNICLIRFGFYNNSRYSEKDLKKPIEYRRSVYSFCKDVYFRILTSHRSLDYYFDWFKDRSAFKELNLLSDNKLTNLQIDIIISIMTDPNVVDMKSLARSNRITIMTLKNNLRPLFETLDLYSKNKFNSKYKQSYLAYLFKYFMNKYIIHINYQNYKKVLIKTLPMGNKSVH